MERFDCLVDGSHDFSLKSRRGSVCSLCGLISLPSSHVSYKSHRYSYKVHFNVSDYESVMLEEDQGVRVSYPAYLEVREKMIRFILDKGRLLKMSLKTLHLAVYLMDVFCEQTKPNFSLREETLVASCCLLVAAKSGELDERIPFISKLKKYTSLTNDPREFKTLEVAVAESLNWDLQKVTFYSFVEFYLTAGVLTPQDRIPKRMIDSLAEQGVEDTVRLLAREEQTRPKLSLDCTTSRPEFRDDSVTLGSLSFAMRNDVIKVFELYARDLSNLVLREFRYWPFSKNCIAATILLYTRTALLEPSSVLTGRVKELCGVNQADLRDVYSKLSEFISTGEKEPTSSYSTQMPSSSSHQLKPPGYGQIAGILTNPGPLGELHVNFDSKMQAGKYSNQLVSLFDKDVKGPLKTALNPLEQTKRPLGSKEN